MKVLLASNNRHKADEFIQIFKNENVNISLGLAEDFFLSGLEVEENANTFNENALIKAMAFSKAAGMPAIADDSGLEIDALDLRPGVFSARYSGDNANDKSNRMKVLDEMKNIPENERLARFICVICYYDNHNIIYGEGKVEGKIIFEEKGNGGFGYDTIFVPINHNLTFAEMNQDEKNAISHRRNAILDLINNLKSKNII